MKKLLKIISISFAVFLVFVIAAVLLLTSAPGENYVREWLENRLTAAIGLPVSIGRFETNLWSRVAIDALVVSAADSSDQPPVLYVGQVRVGYSIPGLLGETVNLKALSVDSVALHVAPDSLGRYGIPLLDQPPSATGPADSSSGGFSIDSVSLSRLSLSYLDSPKALAVELTGAKLAATGTGAGAFLGRATADGILVVYDNLPLTISEFEAAAAIDTEAVRLTSIAANCRGLHTLVRGNIGLADPKSLDLNVSVAGTLDTLAAEIAQAFDQTPVTADSAKLQCRIEGTIDEPDIRLTADLQRVLIQNIAIPSVALQAQYQGGFVRVDTFQIRVFDGEISGAGEARIDTLGSNALRMVLDQVAIASLWQAVYGESSPYEGRLNGQIHAEGRSHDLASWTADAEMTGQRLRYLEKSIPDLTCAADIRQGHAVISLNHGADKIHADITFGQDSLSGVYDIAVPNVTALARIVDQPDVAGGVWARGTIGGSYSNPAAHATVHGAAIAYRNFPVDTLFAELSYSDSSATVIDFTCRGQLDSIDTRQPPFGIDSLSGSIAYEARLRGPLERLTGDFHVRSLKPQYGAYALDSLTLQASLNGSQIALTEAVASRDELDIRLRADYDTSAASGSFDVLLQRRAVAADSGGEPEVDLAPIQSALGSVRGEFALGSDADISATAHGRGLWAGLYAMFTADSMLTDGAVDFDLAVEGPYLAPHVTLKATARALKILAYDIDSVVASVRAAPDALTLDSVITFALGTDLKASGSLGLGTPGEGSYEVRKDAPIQFDVRAEKFDLAMLQGLMAVDGEVAGIVSTALTISGTLAAPRFDGWLRAERGRLLLRESSPPVEDIGVSLLFADSVLTIDSATATVADMIITAAGSLTTPDFESASVDLAVDVGTLGKLAIEGTASGTEADLIVRSDSLDLLVLQPFLSDIDSLAGTMSCRMTVAGSPVMPQVDGFLEVRGLSLVAPRNHARLSDGSIVVRFDRSRAILDSAFCSLNGGRATASGAVAFDDGELSDIALILQASQVLWQEPGTYTVVVDSAALTYGKRQENYVLDGDIVLGEARFTAGLRPTAILPWVQALETVDLELPELIGRSRLDVRIRESDNLWVDNNLARIRLRAEIGVIGTPLRPNFTGLVRIEEGYLLYLDRRFRVNEGTVYFTDPVRFNPDINLDADTRITVYRRTAGEPYTVYIRAQGLLDQLQYGLYSEPPLDKPDIVALLTLGATRQELAGSGNGGNGVSGVLKDRASALASQRVSGYLSSKVGSLFGFDELTIEGNLFAFDRDWGPQLVASKRLSQRTELTYSTTVGHLNDQAVRLGYRLTRRISLQGETDRQGRAGLDLKYGITFK